MKSFETISAPPERKRGARGRKTWGHPSVYLDHHPHTLSMDGNSVKASSRATSIVDYDVLTTPRWSIPPFACGALLPRIATCRDRTARHSLGLDRGPLAKPHDAPCAPSSSAHRSRFSRMRNGLRPRRFLYAAASTVLQATLVTAALPITEGEDGEAIQGCGACRELVQRLLHANGREG